MNPRSDHLITSGDKMSNTEQLADHISECLDRFRVSGFTLATLAYFLDEMRDNGCSAIDVQRIDDVMRRILKGVLAPGSGIIKSPSSTRSQDDQAD